VFGYAREDLLGQPLEMLLPERFRGHHAVHRLGFTAEPTSRPMGAGLELFGLRSDGTEFPVDIQLSSLPTKDGTLPVAAIRDVTERRRLEHLRDDFISNAAHELRTPLTTLAGLGETLARRYDVMARSDIEDAFAAMARQGERARVLIANLLDLSKVEGGRADFVIVDLEIGPLIARALEAAPPPEGTAVTVVVPDGLRASADSSRLEQVVTNLLVNSYRYGGAEVRIDACGQENRVVLSVTDDGVGVTPELEKKLFEPFTRGSQTSVIRGSGIGLALCRRIVQGMGAEISYETLSPHGARFSVSLSCHS
jgi:protein-histidine pros-kinase